MPDLIEIEAELITETADAYLITSGKTYIDEHSDEVEKGIWVPKSLTEYDGESIFIMPEWLAIDKELV